MKKVLVASVGGSLDLIVSAVLRLQPDFTYFLCSTGKGGSDTLVEKIVPAAGLGEGAYAVERVQSPNDFADAVAACSRIAADLAARFPGEELSVVANYTGGTRTMSAGLSALAVQHGWSPEYTERPVRPWIGPVSKVALTAVGTFIDAEVSCSPALNVFLGANGTGKTHLLKSAYALLRHAEEADAPFRVVNGGDKLARVLGGRFRSFFAREGEASRVSVTCEKGSVERIQAEGEKAEWRLPGAVRCRAVFLPSREVLSMYPGFTEAYERRESSFDETYYDACKELGQLELREVPEGLGGVVAELEAIVGGPVRLDVNSFVVDTRLGPIAAPMLAEGHRKLATLAYLIKDGALQPESTLFWDEPEANLNPLAVRKVAQMIRRIAAAGVQVFIATHDDLLARGLSMEAEYGQAPQVETIFFALHRASDDVPVEIESASRLAHLDHNPIAEAQAAHAAREHALFVEERP